MAQAKKYGLWSLGTERWEKTPELVIMETSTCYIICLGFALSLTPEIENASCFLMRNEFQLPTQSERGLSWAVDPYTRGDWFIGSPALSCQL